MAHTIIAWELLHPHALYHLGFIPQFVSADDPRPAREQFNESYAHGGGWQPFEGFVFDKQKETLKYPGDPAYKCLAKGQLRDETIRVFAHAWVMIEQKDGTFEVARMD